MGQTNGAFNNAHPATVIVSALSFQAGQTPAGHCPGAVQREPGQSRCRKRQWEPQQHVVGKSTAPRRQLPSVPLFTEPAAPCRRRLPPVPLFTEDTERSDTRAKRRKMSRSPSPEARPRSASTPGGGLLQGATEHEIAARLRQVALHSVQECDCVERAAAMSGTALVKLNQLVQPGPEYSAPAWASEWDVPFQQMPPDALAAQWTATAQEYAVDGFHRITMPAGAAQ